MRVASRQYTTRELAELAHCSLHVLEYLSEIQLLVPKHRSRAGQHRYDDLNLLRMQQIRIGRAQGLALEEIRRWLDREAFDTCLPRLPASSSRRGPLYLETEAKVESAADRAAFSAEAEQLYVALDARYRAGEAPEGRTLRRWAERHCCYINRWFCPCDTRQHLAFGRAIASHPLHAAHIDRHGSALAPFMLEVLAARQNDRLD